MNTLLLQPTDVLFFRDGRPMTGSTHGHGAAWPLPSVINAALHAALHRAELEGTHAHRSGRSGIYTEDRVRQFGSLVTAGPFPVHQQGSACRWYFPRPLDGARTDGSLIGRRPSQKAEGVSSLPRPARYPVIAVNNPSKSSPPAWWSGDAWSAYLHDRTLSGAHTDHFKHDDQFSDEESTFGIGIDDETGTQNKKQFYTASYLRLRENWYLGAFAEAQEKAAVGGESIPDLVERLFPHRATHTRIIAGGQQRVCTVQRSLSREALPLPLPLGLRTGFNVAPGTQTHLVKWVLLSPAIYPEMVAKVSERGTETKAHPGGWIPNWICDETGRVLLQTISAEERRRRRRLHFSGQGYTSTPNIDAWLVAAVTGKPVNVSGYALAQAEAGRERGGAKSAHLAVPAGSVYYFECATAEAAQALADTLNWHGPGDGSTLRNRRSTLLGEKGFGLGVCGTWQFHEKS